jgi:hypothetical protein
MTIPSLKFSRRLFVAAGLVVIATGTWYYWTKARQQAPPPAVRQPEPFVKLVGSGQATGNRVMEERAEYFDPTPLFVPTDWNYGQGPLPARVVRQPGQVFNNIPPKAAFNENSLASFGSSPQSSVESLPEMLARGNEAPFAGFGQVDTVQPTLAERAGFIEVKALGHGGLVMSESVKNAILPRRDFAPVEFLVLVGRAGLVGDPVLTAGSGWEDLDAAVRNYLVKIFRLGDRLAPGQYVVSFGP